MSKERCPVCSMDEGALYVCIYSLYIHTIIMFINEEVEEISFEQKMVIVNEELAHNKIINFTNTGSTENYLEKNNYEFITEIQEEEP